MSSRASYNFSRFKLLNYTTSTRSTPQPYKSYNYLSNPSALRVGWSKTAFDTLLPVISDCLTLKSTQGFDRMRVGYFEQQATDRNNKRHIDDSFLELVMPLIENHELRDSLIAPRIGQEDRGAVIRYGKLLEILDALAGEVSYRHCIGSKLPQPAYIVTASVDSMNIKHDIDIGKSDLCIQGYLSFVGRSSMQVSIDIISLSISGEQEIVANTNFIMVARSKEGKSAEVPGLSLTTDAAISVFERSKILIAEGIERAKLSVTKVSPLPDEVNLIHSLFLATKAIEKQKEKLITIDKIRAVNLVDSTIEACKVYTHTLPFKWTAETVYKSCVLMHYQSRNIHGNIFGGYIMRECFELSFLTVVCFSGVGNPVFRYLAEVQFVNPVMVGAIVELCSTVTYSNGKHVVVYVDVFDVHPVTGDKTRTNTFKAIYDVPSSLASVEAPFPLVMPREYGEMMRYIQGKRSLESMRGKAELAVS